MERVIRGRRILYVMPLLFLLGVALNLSSNFLFSSVRQLCGAVAVILWTMSLRQRVAQQNLRSLLVAIGGFLFLAFLLQIVKYNYPQDGSAETAAASRLLWYSYYVPVLLIPALSFFAALCVGRGPDAAPLKGWLWLLLPTLLLISLILTNDLHQLAWRFNGGLIHYEENSTGWLYYLVSFWAILLMGAALFLASRRCRLFRAQRRSWRLIPLLLPALIYLGLYRFAWHGHSLEIGGLTILQFIEAFAYLIIAFWETLIRIGMIPSNTGYEDIFHLSSVNAEITDLTGRTVLVSQGAGSGLAEQENQRLKNMPIPGGSVYWVEDLTAVRALNRSLEQTAEELSNEAALIHRENELKARIAHYETQNRIYDSLRGELEPQLKRIRDLLRGGEDRNEAAFQKDLALASIYCAYVKRRANLGLLAEEEKLLEGTSLYLAIRESLEYLRLIGLPCGVIHSGERELSPALVVRLYELFEQVLEAALPGLRAILVNLSFDEAAILRMELDTEATLTELVWTGEGSLSLEREDSSYWLTYRLEEVGP